MVKRPNKLLLLGVVAAAALVVPGVLGPLALQEAYADHNQSNRAVQNAAAGVLAANVNVQANADVSDVNICVIARTCS
jgi:hypothetical protein